MSETQIVCVFGFSFTHVIILEALHNPLQVYLFSDNLQKDH